MRIQPTASLAALASRRLMREPLCGAAPAERIGVRVLRCAMAQHLVVVNACARRRVCGCVVLRGSARVAGTHGRVRWLCPIRKPHNKRIQPTASLAALARGG